MSALNKVRIEVERISMLLYRIIKQLTNLRIFISIILLLIYVIHYIQSYILTRFGILYKKVNNRHLYIFLYNITYIIYE